MSKTWITEALNLRYATKKFDPTKKLSQEDLDEILEAVRLSPSSYGLQAWKIILVEDWEVRKKLSQAAFNQSQIIEASHLIVFAAETRVNEAFVRDYISLVSKVRKVDHESLRGYYDSIMSSIANKDEAARSEWLVRQPYIALGVLLTVCAIKNIDSCPMEGFNKDKVDEILGLGELGLKSVVMCAIGFRAADDVYAQQKKVRREFYDIVIKK